VLYVIFNKKQNYYNTKALITQSLQKKEIRTGGPALVKTGDACPTNIYHSINLPRWGEEEILFN